jgi:hypothetical protein
MAVRTKRKRTTTWQGCYDAGWKGLIADEAFAHPAKFSRNLIGRIYRHMLDRGWLAAGMTVVDPFGGVALGALDAMANGLHWCGVELEPKFHALGNQNIAEWVRRYGHVAGWGSARLLNGDSRRLCEFVGGADCVVSSPPYAESPVASGGDNIDRSRIGTGTNLVGAKKPGYGTTPGSLGNLRPGSVDSVVSSPPYAESIDPRSDKDREADRKHRASIGRNDTPGGLPMEGYGSAPGSLGNLRPGSVDSVISSPPYADRVANDSQRTMARTGEIAMLNEGDGGTYGTTDGNLGNLRPGSVDSVVSSPPFADGVAFADKEFERQSRKGTTVHQYDKQPYEQRGFLNPNYAEHAATCNLGEFREPTPTFWGEAKKIVQQCHAILKPGGIAAWVVKDFVRNKARVTFSADWLKLCESCGFELVEWVHASLVKDLGKHADLYGDVHHRKVERKSFFRRLAEKKGSPRIDNEDVIFVRKH